MGALAAAAAARVIRGALALVVAPLRLLPLDLVLQFFRLTLSRLVLAGLKPRALMVEAALPVRDLAEVSQLAVAAQAATVLLAS